jgi:hypothetical protein
MAVTPKFYVPFLKSISNKEVDMDTDTFKLALFTSSLTINQDTNQYFDASPYAANQCTGTGYTAGGVTISPGSMTIDGATNRLYYDFSDAVWSTVTLASPGARYAVLYDATPASNKPLVMYGDLGADQLPTAGVLTIAWNASGAGYLSVA